MQRKASAIWRGGLKDGKGAISTDSGVLANTQYSFITRFENGPGTNPEELIAAAHAGCFAMKLSFSLNEAGFTADDLTVACTITLENGTITESHLNLTARVPAISKEKFDASTADAKANCPGSKVLNCEIKMDAQLVKTFKAKPEAGQPE